jgi:hypothetical protein
VTGGELAIIGTLLFYAVVLSILYHLERSKRTRSEEQVQAMSRGAESANKVSRIMHEIANEKDAELEELVKTHEDTRARLEEKSRALHSALGDREKIAGLINERIRSKEESDG